MPMSTINTILIKRRLENSPLGTELPILSAGELGFNEVNNTLYFGRSTGVTPIAGDGTFATNTLVDALTSDLQTQIFDLDTDSSTALASISAELNTSIENLDNYINSNFLPLSGGDLTGGLTVNGNISASGTITGAGGLEIFGSQEGDATLFVGDGKVGIGTENPNETLTVSGSISASGQVYVAEPTESNSAATKNYVDNVSTNLTSTVQSVSGDLQGQIDNILSNIDPEALDSLTEIVSAFQSADSDIFEAISTLAENGSTNLASVSSTLDFKIDTEISSLSSTIDANFVEKVESDAVVLNGGLTVTNGLTADNVVFTGNFSVDQNSTFNGDISGNGTTSTIYGFILENVIIDGGEF